MVGSYQVGDIVSYCREARAGERGLQWSAGSRLIGFEKQVPSASLALDGSLLLRRGSICRFPCLFSVPAPLTTFFLSTIRVLVLMFPLSWS